MDREPAEFLSFCEVERRLSAQTCRAYGRDVRACLTFLRSEGIDALEEARIAHLRDQRSGLLGGL